MGAKMKKLFITILLTLSFTATAKPPEGKSKFYDFGDQMIDGEINKPTGEFIDTRQGAKFDRLLRLKKSFLPKMFLTAKERIFK
jgi:hypothetical protein